MHGSNENLESHLSDALVGTVNREIIFHIDVAIGVKVELHKANLPIQNITRFHYAGPLFLRSFGNQTKDASGNIIIVIACDKLHHDVGPAIHRKTRNQLFLSLHVKHAEFRLMLLESFGDEIDRLEFILAHCDTSFPSLFCSRPSALAHVCSLHTLYTIQAHTL